MRRAAPQASTTAAAQLAIPGYAYDPATNRYYKVPPTHQQQPHVLAKPDDDDDRYHTTSSKPAKRRPANIVLLLRSRSRQHVHHHIECHNTELVTSLLASSVNKGTFERTSSSVISCRPAILLVNAPGDAVVSVGFHRRMRTLFPDEMRRQMTRHLLSDSTSEGRPFVPSTFDAHGEPVYPVPMNSELASVSCTRHPRPGHDGRPSILLLYHGLADGKPQLVMHDIPQHHGACDDIAFMTSTWSLSCVRIIENVLTSQTRTRGTLHMRASAHLPSRARPGVPRCATA